VLELNSDLEKILKTHPDQKLPYVAIRGKVKALGSPITSLNNLTVTGTIQQLVMKEHVVARSSTGFWFVEYILQFVFLPGITHHASGNQFGVTSGWIYLPSALLGGHLTWAVNSKFRFLILQLSYSCEDKVYLQQVVLYLKFQGLRMAEIKITVSGVVM
jgi:hypothetical protein